MSAGAFPIRVIGLKYTKRMRQSLLCSIRKIENALLDILDILDLLGTFNIKMRPAIFFLLGSKSFATCEKIIKYKSYSSSHSFVTEEA